jgi:hypothetical protein
MRSWEEWLSGGVKVDRVKIEVVHGFEYLVVGETFRIGVCSGYDRAGMIWGDSSYSKWGRWLDMAT